MIKRPSVIPGFNLTLGYTIFYLSLLVLLPLSMLIFKTAEMTWADFVTTVTHPRLVSAYLLTLGASFVAACVNLVFGLLVAWVLVRYRFFGKRIMDTLIDLPFALPTAVAGITLTTLYSQNGWVGQFFYSYGIKTAFSPLGITLVLIFIGLPFVIRTVQPVLEDLEKDMEEAAASLGARRFQTFWYVILPEILPSLLTGFALAFARALGEYGSVIFIAGNLPYKTEIVPLLIISNLEEYNYHGATAIALVMLGISFVLLFVINLIQWWSRRRLVGE